MKEFLGQYAKIVVLIIVIIPIMFFLLGNGGFKSMMPKPTVSYGKEDSMEIVGDISKRKPPTIIEKNFKMTNKKSYNFKNAVFVDYKNEDGTKTNTTLKVTQAINPSGVSIANPEANFTSQRGIYKVTYKCIENYRGSERVSHKTVQFVCD